MHNGTNEHATPTVDDRAVAWAAELRPVGAVEGWLVARAARASTRVDRLADRADAAEAEGQQKDHDRLRRAEAAAEREVHRSLALLARGRKQGIWITVDESSPAVAPAAAPRVIESPEADAPWPSPRALPVRIGNPEGDRPMALPTYHSRS